LADNKVQFRLDDPLAAKLREHAKSVGWTSSQYARYLLATALGDDARLTVLDQIVWSLNAKLQKRISAVGDAMRVELERILLESDDDD
jgi:hypothetical protein